MQSVYLAGFDVFRPDAVIHGRMLVERCRAAGLEGLYPLDNAIPHELPSTEAASWIAQANMASIQKADFILANLNPFRGYEPDSGTVFEFGYAHALGKPIFAYFDNHQAMVSQVPNQNGIDENGHQVEDFSLPKNLMLATTWTGCAKSFDEALGLLVTYLDSRKS